VLVLIEYDDSSGIVTLQYDQPLASAFVPGAGGFIVKNGASTLTIDHSEIVDEETTVAIQLDLIAPTVTQVIFTGADPSVIAFGGGPAAAGFDHPVPFP
jgi:hypothetical protein